MSAYVDQLIAARARVSPRRVGRAAWDVVRHGDLALVYAVILIVVTIVLSVLGSDTYQHAVSSSSTNLANLRERPWAVLVASAFVVSSPWGLWITPFLVLIYAAAQRWVGRFATVVVAAFGHVGATLVVATGLSSGIANGRLARRLVIHETDVGVSYALVCTAAFLIPFIPRPYRWAYVVVLVGYVAIPFGLSPSFTGVGHSVAFLLGVLLAVVGIRVSKSSRSGA